MSFTFGSYIFFLLVPTIGLFLLGLIFFGRLKIIRYILWTISGLFLIAIIWSKVSHEFHNGAESANMIGKYKLDLTNSNYDSLTLKQFSDLTLTVKRNSTFEFNKQTPFFPSQSGKWSFDDDGDVAITECSFDNDNKTFQIMDGLGTWTFESYNLVNGKSPNKIVFTNDTLK